MEHLQSLKSKIIEIQEVQRNGEIDICNHELNVDKENVHQQTDEDKSDDDSPIDAEASRM